MKKLLLVLVLFFSYVQLQAQDFRFGLQASPSFSWLTTDDINIKANGTNTGLKLSLLGEYYLRENLAIVGGLGFNFNSGGTLLHALGGDYWPEIDVTGTTIPDNTTGKPQNIYASGTNLKYKLRYVEIPVGFRMRTGQFGAMRAFLEAPVFTFGFRGRSKGDVSGGLSAEGLDIRPQVVGINLTWGLGAGVEYEVNEQSAVVAGVFFNQGFTDVTKDSGYAISGLDTKGTEDPLDDVFITKANDSKAVVNNIMIRLAFMF